MIEELMKVGDLTEEEEETILLKFATVRGKKGAPWCLTWGGDECYSLGRSGNLLFACSVMKTLNDNRIHCPAYVEAQFDGTVQAHGFQTHVLTSPLTGPVLLSPLVRRETRAMATEPCPRTEGNHTHARPAPLYGKCSVSQPLGWTCGKRLGN